MKTLIPFCVVLSFLSLPTSAQARFETLVIKQSYETNKITIESYETARIVSDIGNTSYSAIRIYKAGGAAYSFTRKEVVRGPAIIEFFDTSSGFRSEANLLTLEITPEAFEPSKTIVVPPGTNLVAVTLECSTNLVNWAVATNGIYGSPTEAKFFRIRAEQVR